MNRKLWVCLLVCTVMLCVFSIGYADSYKVGDAMEDFSVTLSDGTSVSLSSMLQEKQMVMINLWATWCPPCCREFPVMQESYLRYRDQMGLVALSTEPYDTDAVIRQFQQENNLTELPMGRDDIGLANRFGVTAIPTTVIVDRYGVICWIHAGSLEAFDSIFEPFLAEDYPESLLFPSSTPGTSYTGQWPDEEALDAALNKDGGQLHFTNTFGGTYWPFLVGDNGTYTVNANKKNGETLCRLTTTFTAEKDAAFAFDCKINCADIFDYLMISVDKKPTRMLTGEKDWQTIAFPVDVGEHEIEFLFVNSAQSTSGEDAVQLKNAHVISRNEVIIPSYPKILSGKQAQYLGADSLRTIQVTDPDGLWEAYYGHLQMMINNGETAEIHIAIGDELNPDFTLLVDCMGDMHQLSSLNTNEKGFVYTCSLLPLTLDEPALNYFSLYPDMLQADSASIDAVVFQNEEDWQLFADVFLPMLGFENGIEWKLCEK